MSKFIDLASKRRSHYVVGKNVDYTVEEIADYIGKVALEVPTAFNSQTSRLVIVTGEANAKVWNIIHQTQKEVLPAEMYEYFKGLFEGSENNAFGTILFFEDREAIKANIPTNEERQEIYKEQNAANTQYATWLALTELDLGATLQHFNVGYKQGFDRSLREALNLPESWELNAQMPFGSIEAEANPKDKMPVDEKVLVIK
ncbi:nitroreductase family protein [Facklamia sp. DSM 111018]|uniref:Nitroreductase family protein n=1 Tax=Facklamia lactis TaxID=2749967 RepID=A0ABS0LMS9_9LACT|nr:nitroreductase family protein [Facklamia lactis]MBG9979976.1 nitroreductase family protein [Facklamia lactis]MBG9985344.1 nitroreductase family protein [Facklamia lactis]